MFAWTLISAALIFLHASPACADSIDDIKSRGTLIVGVKSDVPAFGMLDEKSGQIIGLEPDLAQDLADRLGVELKLVALVSADREDALKQHRVDVVIATLNETPERRSSLTLVSPNYYESGASLIARRSDGFEDWSALRNRRICSRRGSFYNRLITIEYGADIVPLYSAEIGLEALRDGRCDGLLGDTAVLSVLLQDPNLAERYEMTLPALYPTGWSIALHPDERGGRLESSISKAIHDWHLSGLLKRLEDKWNIPRSQFVQKMSQQAATRGNGGAAPRAVVKDDEKKRMAEMDTSILAPDIARIVERGELIVAMHSIDNPPFFYQGKDGLIGLEVEMAKSLADKLGVKVRFDRQAQSFDAVVELVARKKADVGISKLSRTLSRARLVRFSNPYLRLRHALILNRLELAKIAKDEPIQNIIRDFNGKIGVIANSSYVDFAVRNFPNAEIEKYSDWQSVVQAVHQGDVVGAYRDEFEIKRLLKKDPKVSLTLRTVTLTDLDDALCIAIGPEDTALAEFVNIFLDQYPNQLTIEKALEFDN
ncbi:transporter substrate-binding domain-containing protein [Allochromatium tepidum]|nr:transporter substrate-binding domain-containing protein [Allochromatium tepidum]